jgi:hypothetical protein
MAGAARDPDQKLYRLQQAAGNYVDLWRLGRAKEWNDDAQRASRARVHPKPGIWHGPSSEVSDPAKDLEDVDFHERDFTWPDNYVDQRQLPDPTQPLQDAGQRSAVEDLDHLMRGARLKFVNVLGAGGLGIACTYEVRNSRKERKHVVAKADLTDKGCVRLEGANYDRLRGARHVVQRLRFEGASAQGERDGEAGLSEVAQGKQPAVSDGDEDEDDEAHSRRLNPMSDVNQARNKINHSNKVIILEMMRFGTLDMALARSSLESRRFSPRQLWLTFDCCESS